MVDMQALARDHTAAAIQTLAECLRDPRHKVAAAVALLDRGWGRPQQVVTGDAEKPISVDFSWAPAQEVPAAQAQTPLAQQIGNNLIELAWTVAKDDDE